jgi:hypothetical protein
MASVFWNGNKNEMKWNEMQPQIMRSQKSQQILIFEINKDYWHVFKYQSTVFNHLGLFMVIGCSTADTQHIFSFVFFYDFRSIIGE